MKWLNAPNSDEHVLCDDSGRRTGFRITQDPHTAIYYPHYIDTKYLDEGRMAIYPVKRWCEAECERIKGKAGAA